jgi:hypothetical protein
MPVVDSKMAYLPTDLIYEQPPEMSREELEAEFASNDPERILHALVAASDTEPPEWVQEWCFKFATHSGEAARRGAAMVLGSIALVYGPINFVRAVETLEELRKDPALKMHAEDSLEYVLHAGRNRTQ